MDGILQFMVENAFSGNGDSGCCRSVLETCLCMELVWRGLQASALFLGKPFDSRR